MLVDRAVKAPSPEPPPGPYLRPLRRPLAPEQLLKVDPFPLRLRQQGSARLGTEVPNDDTGLKRERLFISEEKARGERQRTSPDEHRENDNTTEQVVDDEKDCVDLGCVGLRLLVGSCDARHDAHDVDPPLERDDLKEDEQ
jgi:hypothetical protein